MTQIDITVHPWFKDHCFNGRIILPAVEILLLLAAEVHKNKKYPGIDVRVMEDARFVRFLEIPPHSTSIEALVDCSRTDNGSIRARLLSRVQFKTMARILEHGEVLFPASRSGGTDTVIHPEPLNGTETEVGAEKIYRDLVPFGPAYHTLQESLFLSARGASGTLKAPALPETGIMEQLGSPFLLDGALHAACVHGQQYVDFIPFPVGFKRRVISMPTRPGKNYQTTVLLIARTEDELVYDLDIFDKNGTVYETVIGIRMRKVR
ncbi:MAG: polyketide synthase dehydratase domain-containing protein [Desulfobulbaceae bacterium]|nr:polyketide synthase dehydratase domain-containing protein [Desulfobulbaceae bacterium]